MNKNQLITKISDVTEFNKKDCAAIIECFLETIQKEVKKGEPVKITGFGNFVLKKRAARDAINPMTKEKIHIKASKKVAFRVAKAWKEMIK